MNAISVVNSGLTAQKVVMNYDGLKTRNVSNTQEGTETNSFLSVLKQQDVGAEDSIDTNKLNSYKFGAEGSISNFIFERKLEVDQASNAEGEGTSTSAVSLLGANSDQSAGGEEIISKVGCALDGLVSILDTNGDGTLSTEELAILELFSNIGS
jgi:hypothetical protein